MQDTFSHNRGYFVSGKKVFGRTGFWRISDKAPLHNILKDQVKLEVERPYPVKPTTPTARMNCSSLECLLAAIDSLADT